MKTRNLLKINRVLGIVFFGGLLFLITSFPAYGQPNLFDAPWRGFDTGMFGNGFIPQSFVVGDLDGDADADALVGNSFFGSPGIAVLKNRGDGTFDLPVRSALPNNETIGEVAVSDFDGDGDLDAFATIRGNNDNQAKIAVWRNAGNASFASARIEFPTGQAPVGIWVADFTGDNFADVVTANYGFLGGGNTVSLLQHNGQIGAAAAFLAPVNYAAGDAPLRLAAADLNGDNRLDLAVGHIKAANSGISVPVSILLNGGTGNFAAPSDYNSAPAARLFTAAVAFGDLDNDGDADLIGGGLYSSGSVDNGAIIVRRNNGAGVFGNSETYLFPNYVDRPQKLTIADITGDGFADILAASPTGRTTDGWTLLKSNGTGGFLPSVRYEASQQTLDVKAIDADRDGDLDVLTLARSSSAITVHKNPGSGVFPVLPRYATGETNTALENGDIDRDGDQDLVVTSVDIVLTQRTVRVLKNNADGTFAPAVIYSTAPRFYADAKLRDLNGDGNLDILLASNPGSVPYDFAVMLGSSNGTFAAPVITSVNACAAGSIDAFDLDNDNDLDVVLTEEGGCAGGGGSRIFIARNNGNAQFTLMTALQNSIVPSGIGGGDLNGDGKVDLVTSSQAIGVYLGNGNLTFQPETNTGTRPTRFKIADFNGDNRLDVGLIEFTGQSFGTDRIGISLGNGNGTFAQANTQTGSSVDEALRISGDIDAADVDRDGDLDLAVSNNASNDISIFLNNGNGSLQPHLRYGVGSSPQYTAAADFNGDGKIDLASTIGLPPSGLPNGVVVLRNIAANNRRAMFDFDGDGRADISVYRNGTWFLQQSTAGFTAINFGLGSDKIVPADYDGDGKSDIAVYRGGVWYLQRSTTGFTGITFGATDDVPVPADYDGDGKAELAVFRPSNGNWYFYNLATNQTSATTFGQTGDKPIAADYDADGKADVAVFRNGIWYLQRSTAGFTGIQFGEGSDKLVPADYDGDGKADVAVFRPSSGVWYLQQSTAGFAGIVFGLEADTPTPADYDGDGKADVAVFRSGTWYIQRSASGFTGIQFGAASDVPVPSIQAP